MEGGAVGHKFEMGLHKDYPCQVWFNLVQRFQRKRFKCDLLSIRVTKLPNSEQSYKGKVKICLICIIGINRQKKKFHRKARNIYMLNYSLPCSCS